MTTPTDSYYTQSWSDIIHIEPRATITPEEREAHRRARREGRPSPLSPEQLAEIQRRKQRAIAMRRSAIPEWRQRMIATMTALDNIEDAISTLGWMARAVGIFFPPAIPVAGALLGASAILDGIMMLDPSRWLTNQIKKGIRSTSAGNPRGKRAKRGVQGESDLKPWSWSKALDKYKREAMRRNQGVPDEALAWLPTKYRKAAKLASQIAPSFGEAIEAAQTADAIAGIGLSLGPIFGSAEDAFWRSARSLAEPIQPRALKPISGANGKAAVEVGQ